MSDDDLKVLCDRCGTKVGLTPEGDLAARPCRTPQERALDDADRAARMLADVRAEIAATADEIAPARWATIARICREAQHEVGRAQVALRAGVQFARDEAARKLVQP